MPKSSLEELKAQISAGQYAVDPGVCAATILTNFALIRRVRRQMLSEDEQREAGPRPRSPRGTRPAPSRGDKSARRLP